MEIEAPNPVITNLALYTLQEGKWKDSTNSVLWYHEFEPVRKVVMWSALPVTGIIEIS